MLARLPDRYVYVDWPEAAGESVAGRAIDRQGHVVEFAISWGPEEGRGRPSFLRYDSTGLAIDYSGGRWVLQHEEVPRTLPYPRGSHFPWQIEQMLCRRTIHEACGV
jgi:hypothetical protein